MNNDVIWLMANEMASDLYKLKVTKQAADDKINVTQKLKFGFGW